MLTDGVPQFDVLQQFGFEQAAGAPDGCMAIRQASRAVTHLYDLVLAPTGLRTTQVVILRAIARHGEVEQWRLSEEHSVTVETLSRRLAVLREAGLVSSRIGSVRRGERLYRLTPAGEQTLRLAEPYWIRAEQRLRAEMGLEELQAALSAARRLALAARRAESSKISNASAQPGRGTLASVAAKQF